MRKYFFYIVIFASLLIGILLLVKKSDFNDFFDSWGDNSIAPRSEWRNILIGKWKFVSIREQPDRIISTVSEVEYFPDNKFTRLVILKIYSSEYEGEKVKEKESDLCNKFTGTLEGTWSISDTLNLWYEKVDIPDSKQVYIGDHGCKKDIDLFEVLYYRGRNMKYGDFSFDELDVKAFNKSKILINGRDFLAESTSRILGQKIK